MGLELLNLLGVDQGAPGRPVPRGGAKKKKAKRKTAKESRRRNRK
jgi:hypothetical protein